MKDNYGDEKTQCSFECDTVFVSSELASFDTMSSKSIGTGHRLFIIPSTEKNVLTMKKK